MKTGRNWDVTGGVGAEKEGLTDPISARKMTLENKIIYKMGIYTGFKRFYPTVVLKLYDTVKWF